MINIDVEEGVTFKTSIYNFEGEVIHVSSNTNSIQIQFLPTGIYLLEIQDLSTGQKITEKIVKGI